MKKKTEKSRRIYFLLSIHFHLLGLWAILEYAKPGIHPDEVVRVIKVIAVSKLEFDDSMIWPFDNQSTVDSKERSLQQDGQDGPLSPDPGISTPIEEKNNQLPIIRKKPAVISVISPPISKEVASFINQKILDTAADPVKLYGSNPTSYATVSPSPLGSVRFDSAGSTLPKINLKTWGDDVMDKLMDQWDQKLPPYHRANGFVLASIRIYRNGHIVKRDMMRSTLPHLNQWTLEMIDACDPLPPLPDDYQADYLDFKVMINSQ